MNYSTPLVSRDEELRLLNLLGFPDFDEQVSCPNPYGAQDLTAQLIRDSGDEYHKRPELSHSQFVIFMSEPERYKREILDGEKKPEPEHFAFGKRVEHFLFHDEVPGNPIVVPNYKLQRRKRSSKWFEQNQVVYDETNDEHHSFAKAGQEYVDFCRLHPGREVMTEQEEQELVKPLEEIRDNLREHSKAKALLYGDSLRHIAILFTCPFSGLTLRCQLDNVSRQKTINDYKTAAANHPWTFARHFYEWKYHIQACWYREAIRQLTGGELWPVNYIVTEKQSKCWVVEVFHVHDDWFDLALMDWQKHLLHYRDCFETGTWKRPTHGTVVELRPPAYLRSLKKGYLR